MSLSPPDALIIPQESRLQPSQETLDAAATQLMDNHLSWRVDVESLPQLSFVSSPDGIRLICPLCGESPPLAWWADAMAAASEQQFDDLATVMPCCGIASELSAIDYDGTGGFTWWVLEVRGSSHPPTDSQLEELSRQLLGPLYWIRLT